MLQRDRLRKPSVAVTTCFLAADSMRARLVFNAVVHQYLIPGVQTRDQKIKIEAAGDLIEVMSANRPCASRTGMPLVQPTHRSQSTCDRSKNGCRNERPKLMAWRNPIPSVHLLETPFLPRMR